MIRNLLDRVIECLIPLGRFTHIESDITYLVFRRERLIQVGYRIGKLI